MMERLHKTEVTLGARIHESVATLGAHIHAVETRVGNVEVRVAEVKSDLMKWSFVYWVGAVTAIAALAGVLR